MSGQSNSHVPLKAVAPGDQSVPLTPSIVKQLIELIQNDHLRLGSRLPPERELARILGVSRPSVRQAVKALEAMGIIVCRVGSGNFITNDVSASRLLAGPIRFAVKASKISQKDLFEMRRMVEVQIVGLAATRARAEHLAVMRREVGEMAKSRGEFRLMAQADLRFHLAVLRACGNDVFQLLYEPIYHLLWEDLAERMPRFDPELVVGEHRAIYEAIAARNRAGAMKLTLKHFQVGYKNFFSNRSAMERAGEDARGGSHAKRG